VALNGPSSQYLTVADANTFKFGTNPFTIEGWFYFPSVPGNNGLWQLAASNFPGTAGLAIAYQGGAWQLDYGTSSYVLNIGTGTLTANTWVHLAVVRNSVNSLIVYVNGVAYPGVYSDTTNYNFTTNLVIGGYYSPGYEITGNFSNFRIVNGVAVYTAGAFTAPTTPLTAVSGTQLLLDVASSGAYLTDGSTNNFTVTATGNVTYNASTPVSSGGSLYLDQTTASYLTTPSSSAFNLTGDFTIEFWMNPTAYNVNETFIIDQGSVYGVVYPTIKICMGTTGYVYSYLGARGGGGPALYGSGLFQAPLNTWSHIVLQVSGNTVQMYANGRLYLNTALVSRVVDGTNIPIGIGNASYPASYDSSFRFKGYLTNIRIINGAAQYPFTFTPSTTPLLATQSANVYGNPSSAITGTQTSLLLNTVKGAGFLTDSSTYNKTVTNNNAATSSILSPFVGMVNLTHTTAATVVLNMAAAGGFSWTGSGGFTVADMSNTRTFSVANTSGGSTTTAPNLAFTTGASVATLTTGSWFNSLDFGTTSFNPGTTSLNIDGDLTLSSSGTYTGLTASILGTSTVTTNAKTIVALIIGSATLAGTATLAGAVTLSGALTLTQGSLACSTYNVQSAAFASTGALTRTMTGSGTYTITGSGATAFSNASTGITITGLIISMTAATAKTFAGGGGSYSTLNQGGAGALTISGSNSFADLTATTRPSTITFTATTTQTFTDFTLSGISGSLVTINSSTASTQANLSKTSGTVSVGYLSIRDSNATGGANWSAGNTSVNVSNNTGWIFGGYVFTAGGDFFAFF
jgi:hypothetical protein